MRTRIFFSLIALALTAPAYTQVSAPAAPSVTAGAEFKGLRFDWDPVPGASSYQLEYRAHQNSAFGVLLSVPAATTHVAYRLPLHLFDWTYARYRLAACNSAGCSRSSELSVSDLRRDAVGYFKGSKSFTGIAFGEETDISPDGLNFVVAAPKDYIYSSQGYAQYGGAVYVFRRGSNGEWVERARLTPPVPPYIEGGNIMKVAISADGDTVVLGMPNFWSEEFDAQSGKAYVFHFDGVAWNRVNLYSAQRGSFGRWVGLNDAGDTLAVATGDNYSTATPKRVFIYRLTDGSWQPIRGFGERAGESCLLGMLSGDGSLVAEHCDSAAGAFVRTHSGPNWTVREDIPLRLEVPSEGGYGHVGLGMSADGGTLAAQVFKNYGAAPNQGPSEVQVFSRAGGAYHKVASLTPGAWRPDYQKYYYGMSIAVSGDGGTIAAGDVWDNGYGTGPRAAPLNPDPDHQNGAVYVYRHSNSWVLMNMVKPNVVTERSDFGRRVALNQDGHTLIISQTAESSDADGIGGNWNNYNGNNVGSGAVFLY